MANRHLLRSIVLQTLFECDFREKNDPDSALSVLFEDLKEFAPEVKDDAGFAEDIVSGVKERQEDLDDIIGKAAPSWPVDRIAVIDRNILRMGLFELLFSDHNDVPPKVAINESIELAKTFGGETSGKFVNGVLGAVYKEMGEPGKDEVSSNKQEIEKSDLPVEKLTGAVIYAEHEGEFYLAFVHDVFGYWTLSKGHLEDKENPEDGVRRIVQNELGLDTKVECSLGSNEYVAKTQDKKRVRKQVIYFLNKADFVDLSLKKDGGLDDAKWFKLKDVVELNFYDDIVSIITKAVGILIAKNSEESKDKRDE
ncbi:MAG: transcription antitermination factor NusB [Candidatus Paceibacterota bacterium]